IKLRIDNMIGFWEIFGISFLVALTGALSPGPLLTYTIFNSIKAKGKGFLVGIFVCIGHALLELGLIVIILLGIQAFLENFVVIIVIGVLGGGLLVFLGISILRDLYYKKIDYSFLTPDKEILNKQAKENKLLSIHPILGGIIISLSNPYWILWWVTWGLNGITRFALSFTNPIGFWSFYLGHELGDIIWYVPVAAIVGISSKIMTKKVYIAILVICSLFMVSFGIFLAISTFYN
ncbi:MAG: LysE family transporter, partial [Promethearchaeota archaeon]